MFTGGWIREERATSRRDVFNSISTGKQNVNIGNIKKVNNGGCILPSVAKFQSGHLTSGAIPVSLSINASRNNNDSGSDMDISSEDEDEVYGGKYSLDSSPQDDKIPNVVASRYTAPMQRNAKGGIGTKNLSSRKETVLQRQVHAVERFGPGMAEDELSDSATSTEVSFTHYRGTNNMAPQRGSYISDSYSSSVASRPKVETTLIRDFHDNRLRHENAPSSDIPSAPPITSCAEIERMVEKISGSRANGTPLSEIFDSSTCTESVKHTHSANIVLDGTGRGILDQSERVAFGKETNVSATLPPRLPIFHASDQGPWCAVLSYDACVRLCLHSWAKGCTEEAPYFLNNECSLLRDAFGLQQVLLQSEEELMAKKSSVLVSEKAASKSKKTFGKMKVQVRKVKMGIDLPAGCSFSSLNPSAIKFELVRQHISDFGSMMHSGWEAVRKVRVTPHVPPHGSFSQQSLAYMRASTQYIKQVSRLLKNGVTTLRNTPSSYEVVQETYTCLLRMKSSSEEDSVRMQPGSGETHVFLPDNYGDDLIIEVKDNKGQSCGRAIAQVAAVADDPSDKLRWWPIFCEPEHEFVGKIQLYINYSTTLDENNHLKCGCVAETVAYDFVLEVAMKVQKFQQRNLLLHGPWKWLVNEFASYYGVSDAYLKLRYLSYVMDVATPTEDCLDLVHDLLQPVLMKGNRKSVLSHQENRILGEVEDQLQQILAVVFKNYKSLDELSPSGLMDIFCPATGLVAPALAPAITLYTLLHDILSSEAQLKFCRYFQAAAKKRSIRHIQETDEFISSKEGTLMDPITLSTYYQKMKSLVSSIKNEIRADIEMNNQHVFPSFMDLPNLCASIYSVDLANRLRMFLIACPPPGPSPPVVDLVIATADFQVDLASWNINPVKSGVDAKELFHLYITLWIQDKRLSLLEFCKPDTVKLSGVRTQHSTTPFVDEMYERLKEALNEYEVIISRWPEYITVLENAIADVERAIIEALDKQYADVLSPIKDSLAPKIFGLKYVQKITKRTGEIYVVPEELGILLNTMKRMLDVLRPKIETQLKLWASCIPDGVNTGTGECLSEVTVMLRSKFRSYLQAVVEKLMENTRMQSATKLKKIIEDSKDVVVESDLRSRMQPLKDLLIKAVDHLQSVVETHVFIPICRGLWDKMGQEILRLLQNKRENRCWYKASRIAVSIVDDIFASEMQQLLGNSLQEKDLEPPRSIMEARSVLCKDAVNRQDNNYYY